MHTSVMSRKEGVKLLDDVTIREFLGTAYPRIVAAVSMVAGDRATAEDAVQEALARAWERSSRGETIDSLSAWVTRVALNLSKSRLRSLRVESRARERLARPRSEDLDTAERLAIDGALARLPRGRCRCAPGSQARHERGRDGIDASGQRRHREDLAPSSADGSCRRARRAQRRGGGRRCPGSMIN